MYNARRDDNPSANPLEENEMGTCPKCKLRIRKNGNHVKLGSVWRHKKCPPKPGRAAQHA
jgi:hypothetical protein